MKQQGTMKAYNMGECEKSIHYQFDKATLRPKDVIMKLMNIRQDVEKDESIQSLSIRITQLFNEYKQTMGKVLMLKKRLNILLKHSSLHTKSN